MNSKPLKVVSLLALLATILPCLLFFMGIIGVTPMKWLALAATIVWFIVTPMWMGRELPLDAKEVEI